MISWTTFIIFAIVGAFCFVTDVSHVVRETIMTNYSGFRRLNSLVRTTSKEHVFLRSCKLIIQSMIFNFKQTLNHHVKPLDNGTYEITCLIKGKTYKLLVVPHRGPFDVVQITDRLGQDMTEEYLPYIHSHKTQKITPHLLKESHLILTFADGTTEEYSGTDIIFVSEAEERRTRKRQEIEQREQTE